jgi:hypothetical protein
MRTIYLLAFLLLSAAVSNGQDAKSNVKAAAKNMGIALVKKDYKSFVKTTYPKVVEGTEGGYEKMVKDLEVQVANMEKEGTAILAAWPGEPSTMVDTAGELQCTIPQKMKLKLPEGTLTTVTTLIGLSPDKGKTWYFMDSADRSLRIMRDMFPNISSRLVIPQSPEPAFVPDKK